jgi:predicted HicB family RNase H-like nuclease
MNTMNHKGYTARIEFDERDNMFVGRVLGLRSIISFHRETVADLRHEFEVAIEDFLNDCKEQGVKPEKPASGKSLNQWATEVLQSAAHA